MLHEKSLFVHSLITKIAAMIVLIITKIQWNALSYFRSHGMKHAIRHLKGTDNPQHNAFAYSNSFPFFEDFQKQRLLETKQPPFRITKSNTFHYGAFAWITNSQLVLNSTPEEKAVCWDRYEYIIEKDSWSLIFREIEITYDDKDNKLFYHGHTLHCPHDDGFCKPTILTTFPIVWFPEVLCLIFFIHFFIRRMSKKINRYWLETEHFSNNLIITNLIFI